MDVDSEHEFKIVKMNQEEKKVGLSIRAVGEEASRAEVESYKEREKSPKGSGNNSGSMRLPPHLQQQQHHAGRSDQLEEVRTRVIALQQEQAKGHPKRDGL